LGEKSFTVGFKRLKLFRVFRLRLLGKSITPDAPQKMR
jgi:hypothetical protein